MFAVIETSGKQIIVKKGDRIKVNLVESKDNKVVFDKVLLLSEDKGEAAIGMPYVEGAKVEGVILDEGKIKKVRVFKMKSKKRYRRSYGHRQPYMEVEITKVAS